MLYTECKRWYSLMQRDFNNFQIYRCMIAMYKNEPFNLVNNFDNKYSIYAFLFCEKILWIEPLNLSIFYFDFGTKFSFEIKFLRIIPITKIIWYVLSSFILLTKTSVQWPSDSLYLFASLQQWMFRFEWFGMR